MGKVVRLRRALALGTWREERGAYAILFAVLIVALFIMVAMVVDLSNARAQVRNNRSRVDFAALAAGNHLPADPEEACEAAWRYIRANTPDLPAGAVSPCVSGVPQAFDSICTTGEPARTYQATGEDPYDIRFTYPVTDGHPELQNVVRDIDGDDPCERFAITMRTSVGVLFGGIVGAGSLNAPASSVVRGLKIGENDAVVALLLLDPVGCTALESQGGGGNLGGVKVFPSGATPGFITVDSDGSRNGGADNCNGGKVTMDANGGNSRILACGPGSTLPDNCLPGGQIQLYAMDPGQTSCTGPDEEACDPADIPTLAFPQPLPLTQRLTRSPVDHRYNCQEGYPDYRPRPYVPAGEVPVVDCEDPVPTSLGGTDRDGDGWTSDYVDELREFVGGGGTPTDFTVPGNPDLADCNVGGNVTLSPGNYHFPCSTLTIVGTLTIEGGNVVLDGGLDLQQGATFRLNTNPDASTLPDSCLPRADTDGDGDAERPIEICPTDYSQDASYLYLRSGGFTRGTDSTLELGASSADGNPNNDFGVFAYFQNGTLNFTGGSGQVTWISPFEGTFEDLNLWSESVGVHGLSGGATQQLEGAFFTPNARFVYSGSGAQDQAKAQFLTWQMTATGNGVLRMAPDPDRAIKVPIFGLRLIR